MPHTFLFYRGTTRQLERVFGLFGTYVAIARYRPIQCFILRGYVWYRFSGTKHTQFTRHASASATALPNALIIFLFCAPLA